MRKLALALSLAALLATSCGAKNAKLSNNELYKVSTAELSGYVNVKKSGLWTWKGTMYIDNGELYAETRPVTIKSTLKGYHIKDEAGKHPLLTVQKYQAPDYKEYPETWDYKKQDYKVKVKKDVVYGHATGYWTSLPSSNDPFLKIYVSKAGDKKKKDLELTMDIYTPQDKGVALRPLLVFVHGGGFYNGDKTNEGYPQWAKYFASLGYEVASVNYRLGFHASKSSVEKAGFHAVQDVSAAIRYLVHNAHTYNIDPNRVFIAGTSAGAITAYNVAFMHPENIPESAREEGSIYAVNPGLTDKYSVRAVGGMWGAVHDLSMLKNENVAIVAFHSTGDPVVPFGADHPFTTIFANDILFTKTYGSGEIVPYAKKMGRKAKLYKYDIPDTHSIHLDENDQVNDIFFEIQYAMRDFFSEVMLPHPANFRITSGSQDIKIDGTDVDTSSWSLVGGVILDCGKSAAKVLLFPDAPERSLTVSGQYKSGLSFKNNVPL